MAGSSLVCVVEVFKIAREGNEAMASECEKSRSMGGGEGEHNRTITRLLKDILFICGPSSIICARAERGCK